MEAYLRNETAWVTLFWQCIVVIVVLIATMQFQAIGVFTEPFLYGDMKRSFLDIWSIEHFIGGIWLGGVPLIFAQRRGWKISLKSWVVFILLLSYCWELAEFLLEQGRISEAAASWAFGYEHWSQRLISDPLLCLAGGFVYRAYPKLFKPALIFYIAFWLIHLALPHCMYIQEKYF